MTIKKAKQLKDLEVVEVSLVPQGANKKQFMLIKSQDGGEFMTDISKEFIQSLSKSLDDGDEEAIDEILKGVDEEVIGKIKGSIRLLNSARGGLPKDSREEVLGKIFRLTGIRETSMTEKKEKVSNPTPNTPPAKKAEDIAKEVKAAKVEVEKEFNGKIDELKKSLEASDKRFQEVTKRLDEEREAASVKEYVGKAEKFENLGVEKEKLGLALKAVAGNCEAEVYEVLETALSAANKAVEKSDLFKELGSSGKPEGGVMEEISKVKSEIMKDENVSEARAEALAWERNPALYTKYSEGRN